MVDLGQLPQAELQIDLILHIHDECEGLDEIRGFSGSTSGQVAEVRPGEPVGKPKANVEPAVGLVLDLLEQFSLSIRAQIILQPHPGILQPKNHLGEWPLDKVVQNCQEDDNRTVLTASCSDVIHKLPPNPIKALTLLRQLKSEQPEQLHVLIIQTFEVDYGVWALEVDFVEIVDVRSLSRAISQYVIIDSQLIQREEYVVASIIRTLD